jgi:hypothetical protein
MNGLLIVVNDWLSSQAIADMDATEERGFLRLSLHAARREHEGFPKDERLLANLSLLGQQWWRRTKDRKFRSELTSGGKLLKCFDEIEGRLFIPGVLHAVRVYRERCQQASRAAKKRWSSVDADSQSHIAKMQTHSIGTAGLIEFYDLDSDQKKDKEINQSLIAAPCFDHRGAFRHFLQKYPAAGHERLQRGFEAFVRAIETESSLQSCCPEQVVAEIHAGLDRWMASARWNRNMIHTITNFLVERLWKEYPVQNEQSANGEGKKPSYATARASGEVGSLEEYQRRYSS